MTLEPSESVPLPLPPPPGRGPSREYRAAVAFMIGGGAILVVALLLSGSFLQTTPPIRGLIALVGVILGVLAMLGTAYGLSSGRRWAVAVATPMLVLLVLAGAIETIFALTRSTIHIPIGALLAIWALRAPLRTPVDGSGAGRAWGAVGALAFGAMLISTAWPVVSSLALQSGGPFIVGKESLHPTLELSCPGTPGAAPVAVSVAYDWRWSRAEPWAAGNDTITLAAYIDREFESAGYNLDMTTHGSAGIWQSNVMIMEPQGFVFGIDLEQAGFEPGSVGFGLISSGEGPSPHGFIDVQATYLHAPVDTNRPDSAAEWQVQTHARCEW
ncbi:MAG: hypothetical protein ABIR64_04355 [Candidatus Limnocylindrales bacterium]